MTESMSGFVKSDEIIKMSAKCVTFCSFGLLLFIEGEKYFSHDWKGEQKMKRKMRARLLTSLALAASLLFLPMNSSYAAVKDLGQAEHPGAVRNVRIGGGDGIVPQYVNAAAITADLSIKGNNAHVYASAIAKKVCHITVTMRLQRKENGVWKTKVSWVESSNTGDKTLGKDYTLTQRGTYRTYAVFDVAGEQLTYKSVTQEY